MSVLIKGMEMPTSCWECRFNASTIDHHEACLLTKKTYNWGLMKPPSDCPIIPVPPHGRLIDADELAATCDEPHWCAWLSDIDDAPTIIPAEPPKDEAPAGPYDLLYEEGGPDTR
jgi:hypothetical protein